MGTDTFKFALGSHASDRHTGFSGLITCRSESIEGWRQYLLEPAGEQEPRWLSEDRLSDS